MTTAGARFADIVTERPDAEAVVDGASSVTFGQLGRWADRIAGELARHDIGPESLVALLADRSAALPAAALGIWRRGAAYVPLDPDLPRERLREIGRRLRPAAVVTVTSQQARAAEIGGVTLVVGRDDPDRTQPHEPAGHADSLAYGIHTSGTTGRPKCVGVSHRSLLALCDTYRSHYGMGDEIRRVLQLAGFGFDVATADMARLLAGATLVMCPDFSRMSPPSLLRLVAEHAVEYLEITPTVLRPLIAHLAQHGTGAPDSLTHVVVGGELWSSAEYRAARDALGDHVRLFNTCGLTEATVDNTCFETDDSTADLGGAIPIGRPFESTDALVLDEELRPTHRGELFLGGAQLARGYVGDPATTAARFVPSPSGPAGSRLYRTGDVVEMDEAGVLSHLGRNDDQVKVNGVRLNLAEVQLALCAQPDVAGAAVVPTAAGAGTGLAAYVVPSGAGGELDSAHLRRRLGERVPRAMVPARIHMVDRLPAAVSGKVDTAALRGFESTAPVPYGVAPRGVLPDMAGAGTPIGAATGPQATLRAIWCRLLDSDAADDEDDFFDCGGDSLTATTLVSAVREEIGAELPAGALFAHPTFGELSALVAAAVPAEPVPERDATEGPLAPDQRRLWLLHQLDGGLAGYNIPIVVDMDGPLDVSALANAVEDLIDRHPALRTSFDDSAEPRQRVHPPGPMPLREVSADDRRQRDEHTRAEVSRPFDLAAPPLARALLVHGPGAERTRLILTTHHLAADGRTVSILLRDMQACYAARLSGEAPEPPPSGPSYLDVSEWRTARLERGDHDAQLSALVERLSGSPSPPALPLPAEPSHPDRGPVVHRRMVSTDEAAAVRALAHEHRTTTFVALLAAYVGLLVRWTGQRDLIIGVPFDNRSGPGTADLAGFFIHTAAVRIHVPPDPSYSDVVAATRAAVAHAAANADVPFDVLHHHLRRAGTDLRPATWFNFLGRPDTPPDLPGLDVDVVDHEPVGAIFDLNVYLTDDGDRISVTAIHDGSTLDPELISVLVDEYGALIGAVSAHPDERLTGHAAARTAPPKGHAEPPGEGLTVSRAFAEHVGRGPHKTAIRTPSGPATYGELGRRVGGVAEALARAGVADGDLVAVYARRDADLVVALLAIACRGARFCVLDPGYPEARLAVQLAEAGRTPAILHGPELPEALAGLGGQPIAIGDIGTGETPQQVTAGPAGHVAFTSGTTGRPKKVSASGRRLARFLSRYAAEFGLSAADRFALLSGLSHDPVQRDVFVPFAVGASLSVPPEHVLRSPRDLHEWLHSHAITVAHVTPQMLRMITGTGEPLPDMRLVVCAGDGLFAGDVEAVRTVAPQATVVNGYGSTETPQIVAWSVVSPGAPVGPANRRVPVDPADALVVLAENGRPAGIGESGRIVVTHDYLADGLGRRYDSGDIGRYLPDGSVEILGRGDEQLSVAGFRVEPQGVDAVVRTLPYVDDCRTVVVGSGADARLVAYVCGADEIPAARLRSDLGELLPAHEVPAGAVSVDALPLTANGKLDQSRLPAWRPAAAQAPQVTGRFAETVADVWASVLGWDVPGDDVSFFDVGGTSLLMIEVQSALERRLGRRVSMLTLFERPTVGALARYLAGTDSEAGRRRSAAAVPVSGDATRRRRIRASLRRDKT